MKQTLLLAVLIAPFWSMAQDKWEQKFEQLGTMIPSANSYRTASGAPGKDYWQQKVDYIIEAELDDENQSISGKESITYINNSPDALDYLWVQLDQNLRSNSSDTPLVTESGMPESISGKGLQNLIKDFDFDGGFEIGEVTTINGKLLHYFINKTMMRVDLPESLETGKKYTFNIEWTFNIQDRMNMGGRSGYEYFPKDDNYLYAIAQWFPRMAVYDDLEGWQNKQFLGMGEFTLEFGTYKVRLTVPADFMMGATGSLQNPKEVLSETEIKRFELAQNSFDKPVFIRTEEEAIANESSRSTEKKTWEYHAYNVRDFAFACSRKFIWDAQAVQLNEKIPLAMSYYPKEGNPLWEQESTKAVVNTLKGYSKYTIDYPYPVAISVHTASIGMEYPMICFNYGRPEEDGTYKESTKWGMIGVIIHEVGHNYFPMIINSDERQWTWMDEGLDTFVQTLTEREYYPEKPAKRGRADLIVDYMKGKPEGMRPIMTNSEQILQFGSNAYAKPATALDILRRTIMGPELFDYAFKTYAERWAFKKPSPGDFFRTMEDASAVDLDWFWRGWFYSTDNVDIALDKVKWYQMEIPDPEIENKSRKSRNTKISNSSSDENLDSFGDEAQKFTFKNTADNEYKEFRNKLDDNQIKLNNSDRNFYELTFSNNGGLVMPIIIEWTFSDGTMEKEYIPAEIWRKNETRVTKVFVKEKEVVNIVIDPDKETADINLEDNIFPRQAVKSRFDSYKE
ncbi:MAG: M1 family metallopeptidase [Cyclobacteriaceae bacterium]|jgi:hypothetical protein|nr:M1 family metallopeptidase [Cyclobacteriaceae bacterium]